MQTGYYSSAAGMVTQFNRLDTIANNLANVNTAGFKEDNLVVGDFMRVLKEARDELPNENHSKDGAQFLNRAMTKAPQIVDSYTDHSVGNMQKTATVWILHSHVKGCFLQSRHHRELDLLVMALLLPMMKVSLSLNRATKSYQKTI